MNGWEFNATERRNFAEMMRRAPIERLANVDTDTTGGDALLTDLVWLYDSLNDVFTHVTHVTVHFTSVAEMWDALRRLLAAE